MRSTQKHGTRKTKLHKICTENEQPSLEGHGRELAREHAKLCDIPPSNFMQFWDMVITRDSGNISARLRLNKYSIYSVHFCTVYHSNPIYSNFVLAGS